MGAAVDQSGLQYMSSPLGFWDGSFAKEGRMNLGPELIVKVLSQKISAPEPWTLVAKR